MSLLTRARLRFQLDNEDHSKAKDLITSNAPRAWRGNDMQFECGFFSAGQLLTVANISSITVTVKDNADRRGPVLMQRTASAAELNNALSLEDFEAGTDQHVIVAFTNAETLLDMQGANERDFWLVVTGVTTDSPAHVVTFGSTVLKLDDDGTNTGVALPPLGSNIIPIGALYDGAGAYTLAGLIAGRVYQFAIGTGDTNLVNGSETLTANGSFAAQGTSVILHGTASGPVTATLRWPLYLTADEADARYLSGVLKINNAAGVALGLLSPNGRYLRKIGIDDNGNQYDQPIDLNA